MATIEELKVFAKEADSVGDYEAASKAFDMIESMQKRKPKSLSEKDSEKYDPSVGVGDYHFEKLKRGVVGGVLNIPGYISDIATVPAKIAGRLDIPGFEPWADKPWMAATEKTQRFGDELLNVDRSMKPPGPISRYTGNVAEFAGASVLPSIGIVSRAAKPVLAAIGETSATIGGGLASEGGGDIAESAGLNRAWGEIPAGIFGATSGYAIPTALSHRKSAMSAIDIAMKNKGSKEISDVVKNEGLEPLIKKSLDVTKHIEDVTGHPFSPTLAGRTNSPILMAIEDRVIGRSSSSADRAILQMKENVGVLQRFKDASFPKTGISIQREAQQKIKGTLMSLDDASKHLAAEQAKIASGVSGRTQQTVGQLLAEMREARIADFMNKSNDAIEGIYALAKSKGVSESLDDIAGAIKMIGGSDRNIHQSMPYVFGKILDRADELAKAGKKASFEEIHSMYKEVNAVLRTADRQHTFYLGELKDAIFRKLKKFESPEYGTLGKDFKKWNKDYTEFAETFYKGTGGRLEGTGKYGDLVPASSEVRKFFTPEGIDDFARIYKNDPVANQLLYDGVLDLFAKHSGITATGVIDPKKLNTFLKAHNETLNKMPVLKDKIINASVATETIIERNARVLDAKKRIQESLVAKIAGTEDYRPFIERALTDRKALIEITHISPNARIAVLNEIAQAIPQAAQKARMTVGEYMLVNEKTIKPALDMIGKDHYKNVKTIADAIDMLAAGKPPMHPGIMKLGNDPIAEWTGTSGPSLLSQLRASAMYGFISPTHVASSIGMRFWMKLTGERANTFREYILTSPEVAKDFAAATKAQKSTYLANKLKSHAVAAGYRATTSSVDEILGLDE